MFDLVVLGGGPAGIVAALRGRELGATVALVERGRLGGICTNDGCVPTRVLAKAARLLRDADQFADYGIHMSDRPTVDFKAVLARTQHVIEQMHTKKQLLDHLRETGVMTYEHAGDTRFIDPHTVQTADGTRIEGQRFVLAVGGSPRKLPFPGAEHALTHSDVWSLDDQPARVVIVGGGATGAQLASVFEAFGSKVTLMDIAPRILLSEDESISDLVANEFQARGLDVITGFDGIERIEKAGDAYRFVYTHGGEEQAIDTDAVILAVGWPGNVADIGLDAAGVETVRGTYIQTDDTLRTTAPHIYAAGDVTGRMMLVQSAGYQARVAAENALLGAELPAKHELVPHGGFTDPEYGGVGLTEVQAREAHTVAVSTVPYADLDRAVIDDRRVGFLKLIVDRDTMEVLGAHAVGEQAVEIVSMVSVGMKCGMPVDKLADLELAYPTFGAIIGLAARELVRELGAVAVSPMWRALHELRDAEWEHVNA